MLGAFYGKPEERRSDFVQINLRFATANGQTVLSKLKSSQMARAREEKDR